MDDLDAIEARLAATTPGPWQTFSGWVKGDDRITGAHEGVSSAGVGPTDHFRIVALCGHVGEHPRSRADAEFIAHARQDVTKLVATVRQLAPVVAPDGDALYIHNHKGVGGYRCGNVVWWNERVQGPINAQGCDACESAPDGTWRPLYVRSGPA